MDDNIICSPPELAAILRDTEQAGFSMPSAPETGALLRTLAASRPGGRFLELGTGTGLSAAWLLDGMDEQATLDSVDVDDGVVAIATHHLSSDPRLTLHLMDGAQYLATVEPNSYDLIFADAWPGKYSHLDDAISKLRIGGLYVIDDMLPQPNWPKGHDANVESLVAALSSRPDLKTVKLSWSTGLMIATRIQ